MFIFFLGRNQTSDFQTYCLARIKTIFKDEKNSFVWESVEWVKWVPKTWQIQHALFVCLFICLFVCLFRLQCVMGWNCCWSNWSDWVRAELKAESSALGGNRLDPEPESGNRTGPESSLDNPLGWAGTGGEQTGVLQSCKVEKCKLFLGV